MYIQVYHPLPLCTTGRREINDQRVKCEYCGDKTTYGYVEYHLKKCKYTWVPCPSKCGKKITKYVKRMDLSHHLKEECPNRRYECKLCGETGTYQELGPSHERNCPRRKVECPNAGCGKKLVYHLLGLHIAHECNYTKIPCEICGVQVESKNWNDHRLHDAHHAIHRKTMMATSAIFETVQNTSEAAKRKSEKTSEAVLELRMELRMELKIMRLLLIKAGVICVILLAALLMLIVVLTLRGANETEIVKRIVLSEQAKVSELQSIVYDLPIDDIRLTILENKAAALADTTNSLERNAAELEIARKRATAIERELKETKTNIELTLAILERNVHERLLSVETTIEAMEEKAKNVTETVAISWWVVPLILACCCICCACAANNARERQRRRFIKF